MTLITPKTLATTSSALLVGLAIAACGDDSSDSTGSSDSSSLPQGSDHVENDPAEFTTEIDNPYWPMAPGSHWVYRETDEGSTLSVDVRVNDRTKQIANGVEAVVVRDVVSEDGEAIEKTDDWYAQDAEGNIWYLGEETAEYKNGKVTTRAGSFEAGVDGAEAGIIMPADPQGGMAYREEYYEGEAEDRAEVLSTDEQTQVATGHYTDVLMTKNLVPLEPKVSEYKFYAKGVGPLLTLKTSGGSGSEELVSYKPGS